MSTRTGGELLVACLEAQGVSTAFGVPGESYLSVLDALYESSIRYVSCRQEGGVTYAAEGWGKLTDQPGIAFVTRGPGATNASVGLHTAMQDSTPLILFVGQASTDHLDREAFQEVDYRSYFGSLVKWAAQVGSVDRIPEYVSRAFSTALSGRPGPVVLALPENVLSQVSSTEPGATVRISSPAPSPSDLAAAVGQLAGADRPLIIAGGGGWNNSGRAALGHFAESNHIPVASAFRFNDIVDNHSPCYVGDAGVGMQAHVKRLIREADLVVAAGIRFGEMVTDAYTLFDIPDPERAVIHVHASDRELGKVVHASSPIHASPNRFFEALAGVEFDPSKSRSDWRAAARAEREVAVVAPTQPGPLDMAAIMGWLQVNLPDDVIITNGAGNFAIWPNKHFSFGENARLLAPQSGSMGYGLPAAIAAKIAEPDRLVVCFAGDGDFQMNMQELGTAMQAGAQPIVLILNNGMYGTIRMHQERTFPERVSETNIDNPDFVKIGEAYGFLSERVETNDEFFSAFDRAALSTTGALLELMVPPEMLAPSLSIDEARGR